MTVASSATNGETAVRIAAGAGIGSSAGQWESLQPGGSEPAPALMLAPLESQYFAAAAAHAGGLLPENYLFADRAIRKIPIAVWSGTADRTVPIEFVRATRDAFNSRGLPVQLTEMKNHTHWYYDRANEINRNVWEFLKKNELPDDPVFTKYEIAR